MYVNPQSIAQTNEEMLAIRLHAANGASIDELGVSTESTLWAINAYPSAAEQALKAIRLMMDDIALRHH
jgi:hypothetical protein